MSINTSWWKQNGHKLLECNPITGLTIAFIFAFLFCLTASAAADSGIGTQSSTNASQAVDSRVECLLSRMTLEEKIDFLGGTNTFYLSGNQRLGIPEIKMSDGPMGCRCFGPTTAYPNGIGLASSWDPALARKIGASMGRDCRARGVHILLAPGVNIYRSPLCGRNFEYMGEDPYLSSKMVVPLIQGIQSQQVLAVVKHFACNNQEWDRYGASSEVDERTLHEIYLPAFKAAVEEGGVACVMSAYNLLNGVHCSQNDYLLNQILKKEWKFKGFVMSDWDSTYDAVAAANAGLDLEMPMAKHMNRQNLLPAIKDGRVQESVIDDKVRRMLRTFISAGFLDRPQLRQDIPLNNPESDQVALAGARESMVLLKNEGNTLPLNRGQLKSMAVLGPNAQPAVYCAGGSALPTVFSAVSILDGISNMAGGNIEILTSTNQADAVRLAGQANVAILCVGFNDQTEGEGADRPFSIPEEQIQLIKSVSAVNHRTVVVINSGGGIAWRRWLKNVPAVLEAWYPGQEGGRAVAEILFGEVNPSGKLPATFEKTAEDNPTFPYYHVNYNHQTPYTEGIFVGYRGYEQNQVESQFCFGHGLSYTTFKYGKARVSAPRIPVGGKTTVSFKVKNTGKRAGDEIAQLYIHQVKSNVPQPPKKLEGFQRISLQPGEEKTVNLTLSADQLAYYDTKAHRFVTEPGKYDILIGSSSRDIRQTCSFEIAP